MMGTDLGRAARALERAEDGGMVRNAARIIERVPAAFVMLLAGAGALPELPRPADSPHVRPAGIEEMSSATWVLKWDGPRFVGSSVAAPSAVLAYRDHYDFHSASDVRELVYISGTRRGIVDLFRFVRDDARLERRRCIGAVPPQNAGEIGLLKKLGGVETRVFIEDGG